MGSSEKFCLRWNDFESNISVAFREIREEKDFFDCTLSCGSRQIQAHKLILSACSPFFRTILKQNPHQHPLLYLKGVEFTDMQAVLNFMYHGEVNVAQDELNSFLAVAEDLKVKGLTQGNSSDNILSNRPKTEPTSSSVPRPRPPREEEPPVTKRPRPAPPPVQRYQDDDDVQEVVPAVKQEPPVSVAAEPLPLQQSPVPHQPPNIYQPTHNTSYQENTVAQVEETYGDDGYDYGGFEGEEYADNSGGVEADQSKDFVAEEYIQKVEGGRATCLCTLCGKNFIQKSDAKRHIIAMHSGIQQQVPCTMCGKTYRTEQSMKCHMRQAHGIYKHKQGFNIQ